MNRYYDTAGEPVDPRDHLDVRELAEDARHQHRGRGYRASGGVPRPNEDGWDQYGNFWDLSWEVGA